METVLETERLVLRWMTMEDLDALYALYHGEDVRKYYSEGIPSYEETRAQLDWMVNVCYAKYGFGYWAALDKKTGEFIGRCGLYPWTIEGRDEVEVVYMFFKPYWGQGLGTEAARAIVRYAFENLGLTRIIAVINPGNRASARVAEKIGMTLELDGDLNGEPTLVYGVESLKWEAKS